MTSTGTTHPLAWRMLAIVSIAELLGMSLWFSATAAAPALTAEFELSVGQAAWLTMAVQAGFVAGTLLSAALNLADLLNARHLVGIGCAAGALLNAGVTATSSPAVAIALRFATGMALAGVYPPGMKIAASWFQSRRGTALGVLVGALTVGSAVPHLLAGLARGSSWRVLMLTASGLAAAGGLLVVAAVRDGPYLAVTSRFDPRAAARVFAARGTRLATLGYLGHMWELYAMWTWIATFAAASLAAGAPPADGSGSLVAFLAIAAGALGCVAGGLGGDRHGKAQIAGLSMLASAACALFSPLAFQGAVAPLYVFALVWGFTVVADSAQFSALVAEHSPRDHVGTALTVQTCTGFLLTMLTIRLVPAIAARAGWQWAFLILVPGPLLGAWAMRALARAPDALPGEARGATPRSSSRPVSP